MTKKKIIAIVATAAIAVGAIGTSLAWFLDGGDEIKNTILTDNVDVYLQEIDWHDENGEQFRIGDTILKNPTVTANDGDIYFAVTMTICDENGDEVTDTNVLNYLSSFIYYDPDGKLEAGESYSQAEIDALGLEHINPAFTLVGDCGIDNPLTYSYYSSGEYTLLEQGRSVQLFTTICVPTDITKAEWLENISPLGEFSIEFEVQAVLADNIDELSSANGNPTGIMEMFGLA